MEDKIFSVTERDFESLALDIFHFQYRENEVYHAWVDNLNIDPASVTCLQQIPFLPVGFFKRHRVTSTDFIPSLYFESSGTTGTTNSRHYLRDAAIYRNSFIRCFQSFYGAIDQYAILGLLPSYLERKNSSLVMMVEELILRSNHPQSGFYLYDHERLHQVLSELTSKKQRVLLIGVTFALLDFAEKYPIELGANAIVMETGGMKGRREELTRAEVHEILKERLRVEAVHSEYGMTELLSQAYSKKDGIFSTPPWMKALIREEEDPLTLKAYSMQDTVKGAVNIIDLANIYSCSFIATDDLGAKFTDGRFAIEGRLDQSDLRGCSLMYL